MDRDGMPMTSPAAASAAAGESGKVRGSRFWRGAFVALILLQCAPIWLFRYVPTQDGPSHLDNAAVMAHYGSEPIYRQYYTLTLLQPAGNSLAQFVVAGLLKVAEPVTAEKLFLTAYVVLFLLAFRYLLGAVTPYVDHFSCLAGMCVSNYFFYMGFWNFFTSVVLLLLAVGYYLRHVERWTARSVAVLAAGACAVYAAHVVAWVVCVIAVAVLGIWNLASGHTWVQGVARVPPPRRPVRTALQFSLPVLGGLLPAVPLWLHLAQGGAAAPACAPDLSVMDRLRPIYSLSFIHTLNASDVPLLTIVAVLLVLVVAAVAGAAALRGPYERCSTGMLALSLVCVAIAVAGPDCVGGGLYIRSRVAFLSFLFLLAWVAAALRRWPRPLLHGIPALFCCIALAFLATRVPAAARWNDTLAAVVEVGEQIRPRSTVLQLDFNPPAGIDPALHAVGLLSAKSIINLRNYEARSDHFSTRFRPHMSPFPALGTLAQLRAVPPIFDIERYERETGGWVDYLLFQGWPESRRAADERPENELYRHQLSGFTFVASSGGGRFRLYERTVPGGRTR
jgi:hypothetical protein